MLHASCPGVFSHCRNGASFREDSPLRPPALLLQPPVPPQPPPSPHLPPAQPGIPKDIYIYGGWEVEALEDFEGFLKHHLAPGKLERQDLFDLFFLN